MEEKGMSENKQYENEYKVQAVKLAKKIGQHRIISTYKQNHPAKC